LRREKIELEELQKVLEEVSDLQEKKDST